MVWFKVDDQLPNHPKVKKIPRNLRESSIGLWTLAGAWSASQLTEGRIPYYMLSELGCSKKSAVALVAVGLWTDHPDDSEWRFHQWEQRNPTRDEVLKEREAAAERQRKSREARKERSQRESQVKSRRDREGVSQRESHRESQDPDPTRPDLVSTSVAGGSSSSSVLVRETDEKIDEIDDGLLVAGWRLFASDADVPAGVDPDREWRRFLDFNGDGAKLKDPAAAFRGWLKSAPEVAPGRRFNGGGSPTPTPARPECPDHPGQPTGSVQCPECAKTTGPPPRSLRALRDGAS